MLQYDPTDWDTQIDPYPIYARLREEAPVYHNEAMAFWAVSRFEDVWDVHLDFETFTSTRGLTIEQVPDGSFLPMMIVMDPPQHTRVRQLVSKVFTPRRVSELEPTVRQITRDRLAGLEPGDQIDLFERLGSSMPMDVISTMLGVPAEDRDFIRHKTNDGMHRTGGLDIPESAMQAQAEVLAYFADFVKKRQANPQNDLTSDLIAAEFRGDDGALTKLSFEELLGFCLLLGNAGHETTARLVCNSAVTLARNPDQRRELTGAPREVWENAVEEMLRYDPPSQVQGRWTTRPWTRHGVTIPADVRVLLLTGAAHRDERQFPDPDRFDIHRQLDRTVHFGQGHHLCLGKSLARQECRVAFEEILARFPDYQVDEDNLEWAHNNNVRGYAKVPMRL
jgi:cytochrome P450